MGARNLRRAIDDEILFPIDKSARGIDRRITKMMAEDLAVARRKLLGGRTMP